MSGSSDRMARDFLDHVPIVAVMVGPDLLVGRGGASAMAARLLGRGKPVEGRPAAEVFLPGPEFAETRALYEDWLRLIFEQPDHDWDTVAELCPVEEVAFPDPEQGGEFRELRMTYHPKRAGEGGPVVRLLAVGVDVTNERALMSELESRDQESEESVRRFADVLKLGAETYRRFENESLLRLGEAFASAERLQEHPEDAKAVREIMRHAHTIKANSRAFRLGWIAQAAEELEDALAAIRDSERPGEHPDFFLALERLETLRMVFETTDEIASQVFGRSLDPGEVRNRERDLTVPLRVSRLESSLALLRGARTVLARGDVEKTGELLGRLNSHLAGLPLVPARSLFQRFPKMIADLAAVKKRSVEPLRVTGGDVEVHARALDRMGDALVHLLRNAVAHGIEPAAERLASGKPEAGVIELSVAAGGNGLVFEVADDGRGVDFGAVARQAASLGLIEDAEAASLGAERAVELMFESGFSTVSCRDEFSGRGVGLEVVKAAADFLGGRIKVESSQGLGTRIRIELPGRSGIAG